MDKPVNAKRKHKYSHYYWKPVSMYNFNFVQSLFYKQPKRLHGQDYIGTLEFFAQV